MRSTGMVDVRALDRRHTRGGSPPPGVPARTRGELGVAPAAPFRARPPDAGIPSRRCWRTRWPRCCASRRGRRRSTAVPTGGAPPRGHHVRRRPRADQPRNRQLPGSGRRSPRRRGGDGGPGPVRHQHLRQPCAQRHDGAAPGPRGGARRLLRHRGRGAHLLGCERERRAAVHDLRAPGPPAGRRARARQPARSRGRQPGDRRPLPAQRPRRPGGAAGPGRPPRRRGGGRRRRLLDDR